MPATSLHKDAALAFINWLVDPEFYVKWDAERASMRGAIERQDNGRAFMLLSPAYRWLTVPVFLPLSARAFFSCSDVPFGGREWHVTIGN